MAIAPSPLMPAEMARQEEINARINKRVTELSCHILIIGDYNYKRCITFAKKKPEVFTGLDGLIASHEDKVKTICYDGSLNKVATKFAKYKEVEGVPDTILIIGGSKDLEKVSSELVVVTKLCRLAMKFKNEGVKMVGIGSMFKAAEIEAFAKYNSKADRANSTLRFRTDDMPAVMFVSLMNPTETEDDVKSYHLYFEPKRRLLSKYGFIMVVKYATAFLRGTAIPFVRNKKAHQRDSIKDVLGAQRAQQLSSVTFRNPRRKIQELQESLDEIRRKKINLNDHKLQLEFGLKITNTKLQKIVSYENCIATIIEKLYEARRS